MSRYLFSAVEQALWSVLNFGVNLLLIRFVAPAEYGAFVFWAACGFVLASVQNALTICHLQVLAPNDQSEERRRVERLMNSVNLIFLVIIGIAVMFAALAYRHLHSPYGAFAAVLFVPAYLLQQYVRALNFSRGRPASALVQTALVFVLVGGLLAAMVVLRRALSADLVMTCLGGAYGVVGVAGLVHAMPAHHRWAKSHEVWSYGAYARLSGWIFLGVSSTELLTRFYVFVVAGWYGAAVLGALAATQQLLRPIPLLASAWAMVARADLARHRDEAKWRAFISLPAAAMVAGLAVSLTWTLIIYEAWPWLSRSLFGGQYADERWMVLLWGASAALGFGQAVVSAALQVLRAFKALALANASASVVAAVAIVAIMASSGPIGAITGTAAGQLLELVVMICLLWMLVFKRRAGVAA